MLAEDRREGERMLFWRRSICQHRHGRERRRACLWKNFLFVVVSFIIVIITSLIHKGSPVEGSVDSVPVFILGLDVGDYCLPVVAEDPADLEGIGGAATWSVPLSICFCSCSVMVKVIVVPGGT